VGPTLPPDLPIPPSPPYRYHLRRPAFALQSHLYRLYHPRYLQAAALRPYPSASQHPTRKPGRQSFDLPKELVISSFASFAARRVCWTLCDYTALKGVLLAMGDTGSNQQISIFADPDQSLVFLEIHEGGQLISTVAFRPEEAVEIGKVLCGKGMNVLQYAMLSAPITHEGSAVRH
jgi:hypothetical protein